jgi:hypothetical protein
MTNTDQVIQHVINVLCQTREEPTSRTVWWSNEDELTQVDLELIRLETFTDVLAPMVFERLCEIIHIVCMRQTQYTRAHTRSHTRAQGWSSQLIQDACVAVGLDPESLFRIVRSVLGYHGTSMAARNLLGVSVTWNTDSPSTLCGWAYTSHDHLSRLKLEVEAMVIASTLREFTDVQDESDDCCICTGSQACWHDTRCASPESVQLKCGHILHRKCVVQLMRVCMGTGKDTVCPLCRGPVLVMSIEFKGELLT